MSKKGNKPDFNARAKIGEYWQTIGAAWNVKDGGISLRLNTVPVGGEWDGSILLLPPLPEEKPAETKGEVATANTPPAKEPSKEPPKEPAKK